MSKLAYERWRPGADAVAILREADEICQDYSQQGYDLTLRQLYYQFVSRGLIPNNQKSYDRLDTVINKGRMAGYIDWDHIVDRTRNLRKLPHWRDPSSVIRSAAVGYQTDLWKDQLRRVEVWVEKEALAGVVERAADRWDCAWFSCRGYVSQSEMWAASQRINGYLEDGQAVTILHLGDHDPSGIDMTRDIEERLRNFILVDQIRQHGYETQEDKNRLHEVIDTFEVNRIALNRDQIDQYDPPPNPAKLSDSRAEKYIEEHGDESWELDALDPATLDALIEGHIEELVDAELMEEARESLESERDTLLRLSDNYPAAIEHLEREGD